jgi:hypothetical protein
MHRVNHIEHKRKRWHWLSCTRHNCALSLCIFIWNTSVTCHKHITVWLLRHPCQGKDCSRELATVSIHSVYLSIFLSPCVPVCLFVRSISQQSICPSTHVLALSSCMSGLPTYLPALCLPARLPCLPCGPFQPALRLVPSLVVTLYVYFCSLISLFFPFCF